ncbi:MAG TPA: hypothetical protein VFO16_24240, partial [Pseudonocardiaceae bacterium]|nr:hypothetical protein [Pseudonocardiaceae bacterium]
RIERDVIFTAAAIDAWKADPHAHPLAICPACRVDPDPTIEMLVEMAILYQSPRAYARDLFPQDFVIDVDDGHTWYKQRVSSLTELRTIERESERHARNEPKCTPLVFREFSQSRSNRLVHTLTDTSYERGRAKKPVTRTQSGQRIVARAVPDPT